MKGSKSVGVLLIVLIILLGIGGYFYYTRTHTQTTVTINELGLTIQVPRAFSELTYTVVQLPGDQAVNSVGFSTRKLDALGCTATSAPLGYLTYNAQAGGDTIGTVHNAPLFFVRPESTCNAPKNLLDWDGFEKALHSVQEISIQGDVSTRLRECGSLPNGSTQEVTSGAHLVMSIPSDIYKDMHLEIKEHGASVNTTIDEKGATSTIEQQSNCWLYPLTFKGEGAVDIFATSSTTGISDYFVHFVVASSTE